MIFTPFIIEVKRKENIAIKLQSKDRNLIKTPFKIQNVYNERSKIMN